MLAIGALLVAVALLTLAAVAPVFRRDNPPRWTTRGWVGELVTLAIVCTLALGIGYFGAGVIGAVQTGADYVDIALLGVVVLVAIVLWRRLRARPASVVAAVSMPGHTPGAGPPYSDAVLAGAKPAPASASVPPPPHRAA